MSLMYFGTVQNSNFVYVKGCLELTPVEYKGKLAFVQKHETCMGPSPHGVSYIHSAPHTPLCPYTHTAPYTPVSLTHTLILTTHCPLSPPTHRSSHPTVPLPTHTDPYTLRYLHSAQCPFYMQSIPQDFMTTVYCAIFMPVTVSR